MERNVHTVNIHVYSIKFLRWGKKNVLNRIERKSSGIIELGELVRILTTGKFFFPGFSFYCF